MTTTLPNENLTYIQNGEPVSGGVSGNSDGVLNRPLVQLHNNVDAVRDAHDALESEVVTARDGEASLSAKLTAIDNAITDLENESTYEDNSALEIAARAMRDRIPSSFDYAQFNKMYELDIDLTTARTTSDFSLVTQPLASATTTFANHIALAGTPKNIYVDGYKLNLDIRPEYNASMLINLGAAPSTGSRLDFAFLEVWKEKVVIGAADDVLFPNGAVNFDKGALTTFNSCTLYTADASGGNNPAYLASASGHGAYIKANDANIEKFLANPDNNTIKGDDGNYYQIRYRVRVVNGVSSYLTSMPHGDTTNIKAQGKLATPSAISYSFVSTDAGLSAAVDASLALDSIVRAVPLAIIHRRNSTAWSLTNPNGAGTIASGVSGRPDGKFCDHIHFNDVCDLRQHGVIDNNFDFDSMYEKNLNQILESKLMTTFEPLMSDSDGNGTYKDLNIYGTKLMRAEGLVGSVPFDAGWEVINVPTAQNGVKSGLDGIRNYFSDVGGEQAVTALIPDMSVDGVNPTSIFTYVSSTKTLTIDASDLKSGNDENPSHASRTKISTRRPHLKWGAGAEYLASYDSFNVSGTWSGLGGDSAVFTLEDKTYTNISVVYDANFAIGDIYQFPNGVDFNITGVRHNIAGGVTQITGWFSGSTVPTSIGTFTKISGSGPATTTKKHSITDRLKVSSVAGVKINDLYVSPDSHTYKVFQIDIVNNTIRFISNTNTYKAEPELGVWTKSTGDGPATLTSTVAYNPDLGYEVNASGLATAISGISYALMPTNTPIHIQAYLTFQPGSGFMNRIPYQNNDSFLGCQFNVDGTQVLPNNGIGFIPFGSTVDPINDGNLPVDSHSRTSNLMGFQYKGAVMDIGTEPNGYNSVHSHTPSVIKDGSTYKMWFSGYNGTNWRILYSTSTDGTTWSTPVLAMDIGTEPNGYNSVHSYAPSVIKDGSTYKMWFSGSNGTNWRILYSTSTDGTTWSTPVLAMDIGTEPNGYNSVHSFTPSVIKDGSTYKMWFSGYRTNWRILYSTSTDGTTWSTPVLAMDIGTEPNGYNSVYSFTPSVIKDGSTYKMWFSGSNGSNFRILYSTSIDGTTWSTPVLAMDIGTEPNGLNSTYTYYPSVIKDGSTYKMWFSGYNGTNWRILHAVLAMTDTANTGSSTTGVYSTTGTMNHAPAANSQVVVFYEAMADQLDRSLIDTTRRVTAFQKIADKLYLTTLGTGVAGNPQDSKFRDVFVNHTYNVSYSFHGEDVNSLFNCQKVNFITDSQSDEVITYSLWVDYNKGLTPAYVQGNPVITQDSLLDSEIGYLASSYSLAGVKTVLAPTALPVRAIWRGIAGSAISNYIQGIQVDMLTLDKSLYLMKSHGSLSIVGYPNTNLCANYLPLGRPILK